MHVEKDMPTRMFHTPVSFCYTLPWLCFLWQYSAQQKKIRRQFPQTQQKGYLCRRKKFNMSFLCWIICCRNKSVMYTIYVWTFNETHLAKCTVASREITCARNVPEVASRHTVFQNFPYPALSLTRMPPWQPNSAPPTLWFPHITFLKFENPVI